MNMISIRKAFAGIGAGLVALLVATTPSAQATTTTATTHRTTGTAATAAALWYSVPQGHRPTRDDMMTRHNICRYAQHHGGVRARAITLVADMTHDTYRNDRQVNAWVADAAQGDCLRLGYNDDHAGLASVNLNHLPHRDCWVEVSTSRRKISEETLCNG